MRVCFLTHYYPPEVGAPQARISALARALAARGASVAVHTGFPHYPDGAIKPPYANRPYLVEWDGPVKVVRTAVYPAPNRGFARRIANHTSLALSAVVGASLTGPADVVVAESPPLFTAAAGVAYAGIKRAALVLHVADLWPASAVELGALSDPRAIRAATWLEHAVYRRAAAIVAPADGITSVLEHLPASRGKVHRLGPSVDASAFDPSARGGDGRLRVLYAGTIGLAQGIDTLFEAARIAGPDVIGVTVAGDGADAPLLRERLRSERIENVEMIGSVPAGSVPRLYADADAAAVLLRDRSIFHGVIPTKLLDAMAAGRAIVLSARGEAARLVTDSGSGVVVAPEDADALAAAFAELAADRRRTAALGAAGRACALERFDRERVTARWEELLDDVATASGGTRRA